MPCKPQGLERWELHEQTEWRERRSQTRLSRRVFSLFTLRQLHLASFAMFGGEQWTRPQQP